MRVRQICQEGAFGRQFEGGNAAQVENLRNQIFAPYGHEVNAVTNLAGGLNLLPGNLNAFLQGVFGPAQNGLRWLQEFVPPVHLRLMNWAFFADFNRKIPASTGRPDPAAISSINLASRSKLVIIWL